MAGATGSSAHPSGIRASRSGKYGHGCSSSSRINNGGSDSAGGREGLMAPEYLHPSGMSSDERLGRPRRRFLRFLFGRSNRLLHVPAGGPVEEDAEDRQQELDKFKDQRDQGTRGASG